MGQRLILTTKRTEDFRRLDTGSFFVPFVSFVVDFDAGADDFPVGSPRGGNGPPGRPLGAARADFFVSARAGLC